MGDLGTTFKAKWGPLPVWAWAVIAAGAGWYLWHRYSSGAAASTAAAAQPATTTTSTPPLDLQQIPVYIDQGGGDTSSSSATDTGTTTTTGQTGESGTFAANLAAGLVPIADGLGSSVTAASEAVPGGAGTTPTIGQFGGGRETQTYQAVQTPGGVVYVYGPSATPGLQGTAAYFVSPTAQWQIDSNAALDALHGTLTTPPGVSTAAATPAPTAPTPAGSVASALAGNGG